jgi:tetratricopeptide (TPR) repeat protein
MTLNNQAVNKIQTQDINGAIVDFSAAIEMEPGMVEAYIGRGIAHSLGKNPQAAIADYSKALSLKPDRAEAYLHRADDRLVLGDTTNAIADLKQAKELFTRQQDRLKAKDAEARLAALQSFAARSPSPAPQAMAENPVPQPLSQSRSQPTPPPKRQPTPQPTPQAVEAEAAEPTGYIDGNCGDLAAMGLSRFRPGDPNYTARRDRDGDGIACE